MNSNELISVIIPVYNVARYLPECLNSVIHQTYQNLEILLVDDGSTDNSGKVCADYARNDFRIKVIHQKNMGVAEARNTGISHASGTYVAFIDADDWAEPDALEAMLDQMYGADIVTAGYWKERESGQDKITGNMPAGLYSTSVQLKKFYKTMLYSNRSVFDDTLSSIWNKLFRMDLVKQFYKNLNTDLRYREDTVFVYTYFLRCGAISVSDGAYYHYRVREGSAVASQYRLFLRDVNDIYLYLDNLFSRHSAAGLLQPQLHRWIVELTLYGINEKMGLLEEVKPPVYHLPYRDKLLGKRVVLYGAGKIGKEYQRSLIKSEAELVLWVDRAYEVYHKTGLPVKTPDSVCKCKFDYILVAVKEKEMAQTIRDDLTSLGIAQNKILWQQPELLFGPETGG